ncbi:MAG TPA: ABC transporter permease [Longimicrobiales bacterium]|nr:ABC transporter permease [Longimicrobiales bacterium]
MDLLLRDVRYAARRLRKSPGFTLVALLSLALGIGANTAIFSLVNAILLRKPTLARPEELVELHQTTADISFVPFAYPDYDELRRTATDVFAGISASGLTVVPRDVGGRVESLTAEMVSGNYFPLLGIRPELGRLLGPEDDVVPGGHPVVVLSDEYWRRAFGRDPGVLGREIRVGARPYTVIGVAPPDYQGNLKGLAPALYFPILMVNQLQPSPDDALKTRSEHSLFLTGRVRPGISLPRVRAALAGFDARMKQLDLANWPADRHTLLVPMKDVYVSPLLDKFLVPVAGLLLVVVALVVLIVCANLASFLLARAQQRQREIAIRLALGAPRKSLVRQLLVETVFLSLLGGAAGILLARLLLRALLHADLPVPVPITLDLGLDVRVLAYATGVSVLAGILFGLAPALQSSRPDVVGTIKSENTGGGPPRRITLRGALVVGQVCASLLLLVAAGLFLRSMRARQTVDPGFGYQPTAMVTWAVPSNRYVGDHSRQLVREIEDRIRALPGVVSVGTIANMHLNALSTSTGAVNVDGYDPPKGQTGFEIDQTEADAGFFDAAGIPILRGRDFGPTDLPGGPRVAIVNEAFAARFWPGQDAVGHAFRTREGEVRVVGVARNAKIRSLGETPRPFIYFPLEQSSPDLVWVLARTRGDAVRTTLAATAAIHAVDPDIMILWQRTMERHLANMLLPARLGAVAFTAFALLALTLAVVGVYGVVGFAVARRSREVGIRLSLGAEPGSIVRLLMRSGLKLVGIGAALGLVLSALLARTLSGFLYGVPALDPVTFVGVPLVLLAAGALAAFLPARRAARVDPVVVLKAE